MDGPNSIAKSLGALSVSQKLFEMSQDPKHKIKSCLVTDQEALESCFNFATGQFLSDHKFSIWTKHSILGWPHFRNTVMQIFDVFK